MKQPVIVSISLLLFCLGSLSPAHAADWPQWRGMDQTCTAPAADWNADALKPEPKVLWRAQVGSGYSAVSIADGLAFTMGNAKGKDTVFAFDARSGKQLWSYSYDCNDGRYKGPRATPAYAGGMLYTLSREGLLHKVSAEDGSVIWSRYLGDYGAKTPHWGFASSPIVKDGKLYLNAGTSGICIDTATGKPVWISAPGVGGYASIVPFTVADGTRLLIFGKYEFFVSDAQNGRILERTEWKTSWDVNAADPLIVRDGVFISSGYGVGSAFLKFDRRGMKTGWTSKALAAHTDTPVLFNNMVVGIDGKNPRGKLVAIDIATGEELWRFKSRGGALMAAGNDIVYLEAERKLHVGRAERGGFRPRISVPIPAQGEFWTKPSVSNGRLYCRTTSGELICINVAP